MSSHPDEGHDEPAMAPGPDIQAEGPQVAQNNRSYLSPLFLGLRGMRFPPVPIRTFFGFLSQKCAAGFRWMLARTLQGAERVFFRSHAVRASTRTNLGLSARGAASTNMDSSKMSAGASTNIAEVVDIIDQALRGGMPEDAWSNIFEGLEAVTQACPNSRLSPSTPEYLFSAEELRLMMLAAELSSAAYARNNGNTAVATTRSVEEATSAALDGSVKASILMVDDGLVVVAFRGTVSLVDWLVNLDGELADAGGFLDFGSAANTAHAGLLRVAKAMASRVCEKIMASVSASSGSSSGAETGRRPILLITGHSAGGGVAALMSAHIRTKRPDILDQFETLHCLTFAAPLVLGAIDGSLVPVSMPMSTPTATATATTSENNPNPDNGPSLPSGIGLSLNLVNYGDIVPRADKAYIRSLLTLYRERGTESHNSSIEQQDVWDFGDPTAWNYGRNIVVMDIASADAGSHGRGELTVSQDGAEDGDDAPDLRAFDVSPQVWRTLAFGSKKTHPMAVYLDSVHSLARSGGLEQL